MNISQGKIDDLMSSLDAIKDRTRNKKIKELANHCIAILVIVMLRGCLDDMFDYKVEEKQTTEEQKND